MPGLVPELNGLILNSNEEKMMNTNVSGNIEGVLSRSDS